MSDQDAARALLVKMLASTSLTVQPVQGDILLNQIVAALRAERGKVFEEVSKEIHGRLTASSVLGTNRFDVPAFIQWCEQQAQEEER